MRTSILEDFKFDWENSNYNDMIPYAISLFVIFTLIRCICSTNIVFKSTPGSKLAHSNKLTGPYKKMGGGGFGTVYKCTYNSENAALKLYHGANAKLEKEREGTQLVRLKGEHDSIVQYYGEVTVSKGQIYNPYWISSFLYSPIPATRSSGLLFEWAEHGDLRHYLDKYRLSSQKKLNIAQQIASGLNFIHDQNIVHQDLKPQNILIVGRNCDAKITDFGIARCRSWRVSFNGKTVTAAAADYDAGGTALYAAPEIAKVFTPWGTSDDCTTESDIFSLGILLWEIATTCRPQRTGYDILNGKFDLQAHRFRLFTFEPVIKNCIEYKSSNRPSASEVLKQLR